MTADLYLACQGNFIEGDKNLKKRFAFADKDEQAFVLKKAGWGAEPGLDDEAPRIKRIIWPNGMRECRPAREKKAPFKVAFLGCSYTFGTGVEAKDTMVWLLNERYPDVVFDNWGCYGWGPVQMTARLEKLLQDENYNLIVYNALPDHMTRNYKRRAIGILKAGESYIPVPYAEYNMLGHYKHYYVEDLYWPCQDRFLTVDFLKRSFYAYNTRLFEEKYDVGRGENRASSELFGCCINNMYSLCFRNNVDFVVCSLEDKRDGRYDLFVLMDNPYIRCETVNLTMPNNESIFPCNRVLNNPKFHPNKNVHKYWAGKFSEWFDKRRASK
ncbi:hypothetical protein IJT93_08065 [bacterium]|nr:hypothetical protein [bacterium]